MSESDDITIEVVRMRVVAGHVSVLIDQCGGHWRLMRQGQGSMSSSRIGNRVWASEFEAQSAAVAWLRLELEASNLNEELLKIKAEQRELVEL